jgi:aspartate kinase
MTKEIVLMKFGGTSMGSAWSISRCAELINSKKENVVVVVSAASGVTDMLLQLIDFSQKQKIGLVKKQLKEIIDRHTQILEQLCPWDNCYYQTDFQPRFTKLGKILEGISYTGDLSDRTKAYILSYGERFSSFLLVYALEKYSLRGVRINSKKLIITDSNYLNAKCIIPNTNKACKKNILPLLSQGCISNKIIPVITGFFGKSTENDITLLGRGGSDYSASIIGAALDVSRIEIWTDVNGIMTGDPKIETNAKSISRIDNEIAAEMAFAGAKVLHPKTIEPAKLKNIPVAVLNTFNPTFEGTLVLPHKGEGVVSISCSDSNAIINIKSTDALNSGFILNVSSIIAANAIPIDVFATSEMSISFSIKQLNYNNKMLEIFKKIGEISVIENAIKVSIIGYNIARDHKVLQVVFNILAENKVDAKIVSISSAPNNITLMFTKENLYIVRLLHKQLIEN